MARARAIISRTIPPEQEIVDIKELKASGFTAKDVSKQRLHKKVEELATRNLLLQTGKIKLAGEGEMYRALAATQVKEYRDKVLDH
jgi:hypothetical protein